MTVTLAHMSRCQNVCVDARDSFLLHSSGHSDKQKLSPTVLVQMRHSEQRGLLVSVRQLLPYLLPQSRAAQIKPCCSKNSAKFPSRIHPS